MARVLKPKREFPIDWSSIELAEPEILLCFDQSLLNTGWVLVFFDSKQTPEVLNHGTIVNKPIPGRSGMEDSFMRGEILFDEIAGVIADNFSEYDVSLIVHETPSLMGFGGQSKAEAAPIAAMAVRTAARTVVRRDFPVEMLQAEVVQAWIGGRRGSSKNEIHAAMWEMVPQFHTNEHVRDALAIGLTYVARRDLDRRVDAWRAAR